MYINEIRTQFPILHTLIEDQPLVYFDNAATTQKPQIVIDAIDKYYKEYNANVHRGIHTLSRKATYALEEAREKLQSFVNAKSKEEILFTKGTTDSINLVAQSLTNMLKKGDEIIISTMEHHSNIVPWQMLCERTGAVLKVIPLDENIEIDLQQYESLLTEKTKLVSVCHISNTLGIVNPIKEIIEKAHSKGAWVLIDAAQSVAHVEINVQALDCEFLAFSGHKMYGPTGTGVLYGKKEILQSLPPVQGGGEMIEQVTFEKTTYADLPFKFEAGTPNIAGFIGLGFAVDFLLSMDRKQFPVHDKKMMEYCQSQLMDIPEITVYAPKAPKIGAISFNLKSEKVHSSDVGFVLDKQGVQVRTGHHCTQPLMSILGVKGTVRASFAVYNTIEEVDECITALQKAVRLLVG